MPDVQKWTYFLRQGFRKLSCDRQTDKHTDTRDRNYIQRRFAGGQKWSLSYDNGQQVTARRPIQIPVGVYCRWLVTSECQKNVKTRSKLDKAINASLCKQTNQTSDLTLWLSSCFVILPAYATLFSVLFCNTLHLCVLGLQLLQRSDLSIDYAVWRTTIDVPSGQCV